jgi:hypothetical protein
MREKRGLCYTIFARPAPADTGMMTIYAGTGGETAAGLADPDRRRDPRAADDLSEAEVARARAQIKAGLLMGLESPSPGPTAGADGRDLGSVPRSTIPSPRSRPSMPPPRGRWLGGLCGPGGLAMALYGPVAGAPDLAALSGSALLPDAAAPAAALRIETERLTLRLPRHADFRAWVRCAATARPSCNAGSQAGPSIT